MDQAVATATATNSDSLALLSEEALIDELSRHCRRADAIQYQLILCIQGLEANLESADDREATAAWLARHGGLDLGEAREQVRIARALTHLPELTASFARGELSHDQVRRITRTATARNETYLIAKAQRIRAAGRKRAAGRRIGGRAEKRVFERQGVRAARA